LLLMLSNSASARFVEVLFVAGAADDLNTRRIGLSGLDFLVGYSVVQDEFRMEFQATEQVKGDVAIECRVLRRIRL
jgi:hypothetical protein